MPMKGTAPSGQLIKQGFQQLPNRVLGIDNTAFAVKDAADEANMRKFLDNVGAPSAYVFNVADVDNLINDQRNSGKALGAKIYVINQWDVTDPAVPKIGKLKTYIAMGKTPTASWQSINGSDTIDPA